MSWTHTDSQFEQTAQAVMLKKPALWTASDLVSFVAYSLSVVGDLQAEPTVSEDHLQTVDVLKPFFCQNDADLASTILYGWSAIATKPGPGGKVQICQNLQTTRAHIPQAGMPPAVWAIIAISAAVGACACAWIAREAAPVADRYLARSIEHQALVEAEVSLVQLAKKHADAENAAGKPIAFNAAELAAIDILKAKTSTVLAKIKDEKPYESPPLPSFGVGSVVIILGLAALFLSSRST